MKKFCALLLAIATALPLAACHTQTNEPSDSGSMQESDSSNFSTESEVPWVENELAGQIRSLFSGQQPDRTMKAKNILSDLPYTYTNEPVDSYSDPNRTKLRDGKMRELFDAYSWVGFRGGKSPTVDYDLGNDAHGLSVVVVNCLRQVSYGIELPTAVSLSASADGETYTVISTLQSPADIPESGNYTYRFSLPQTLRARYLRVTMTFHGSSFLFVDEIAGYAYCPDGTVDLSTGETSDPEKAEYDFYHYALQTKPSTSNSPTDADYNQRQNLALLEGVQVQVDHFDPMNESVCSLNTAPDKMGMLVDGIKAKTVSYGDAAFVKFVRGYGRHVVVDLGNTMAVDEVTLQFLNFVTVGVGAPPAVMIEFSLDGKTWTTVYGKYTGVYGKREEKLIDIQAKFQQAYRCRYVRCTFLTVPYNTTSSSAYLSEIEVFGKKNIENAPEPIADTSSAMGHYPTPEAAGCENLLLLALGGGNELTVQNATPMLRYQDAQGNLQGRFFDSYCMAPANSFQQSKDAKETMHWFYDELFAKDKNVDALNQATAQQNLGEKTTIWFSLFCPKTGGLCSDVDGDGKAEDFSTVEGRLAYLKYQIQEILARIQPYEHLELSGFYWNDECLFEEELELNTQTIRQLNEYIHSLGYQSFWCPYFNAYGFWMWEEIGFDFAVLQPNYMFYATETTRLSTAAETARMLGMGVELEIEDATGRGSINAYRKYLRQGYDSGYMNSVKMYYHGGTPGAFHHSCQSTAKDGRTVYEDTYQFATRALTDDYNQYTAASLDAFTDQILEAKDGKTTAFTIGMASDYRILITNSPVFGKLRINQDGTATYTGMQNYRGEEQIGLRILDQVGNSKEITITIRITG